MKICLQVLQLALPLNLKSAQVYILEKTASLPVTDNRRLEKACNIIIIIIINEKINVAFSRRTARTRNSHKKNIMDN